MISWNESVFAAFRSYDQLDSFSSISIIRKLKNMNNHTLKIVLKDRKLFRKA